MANDVSDAGLQALVGPLRPLGYREGAARTAAMFRSLAHTQKFPASLLMAHLDRPPVLTLAAGQLEREPLDINLLVEDVFRLVSADASLRYVTINADLSLGLPPVEGDRIHLQQVLLNVILNALDAMVKAPPGKRRLAVRTSQAGNSAVEVSVTDSGPGIEPDDLPRVFEPFFTTKPNGIGMGLAISRKIVEAHGGHISAANHPAGGAIFRVTLPALRGKGPVAAGT